MLPRLLLAAAASAALTVTLSTAALAAPGSLMIYTSTPNEAMTALVAEFNKAHPEVKVEFFRSGTTEVLNKLQAEFAAGTPARRAVEEGRAIALRWPVHPRLSQNAELARSVGAEIVIPAFGDAKHRDAWAKAFAPARIALDDTVEI